jgi:class 3 adenylate cyclase
MLGAQKKSRDVPDELLAAEEITDDARPEKGEFAVEDRGTRELRGLDAASHVWAVASQAAVA